MVKKLIIVTGEKETAYANDIIVDFIKRCDDMKTIDCWHQRWKYAVWNEVVYNDNKPQPAQTPS